MKNTVLTLLVLLVLLAFNQSTFAQASWTEASQIEGISPVPGNNQVVPAQVIPGDGIDFYTDAALWSERVLCQHPLPAKVGVIPY